MPVKKTTKARAKASPKTPAKRAVGRPTKYSKAMAVRICAHIAGGKSLNSFCRKKGTPVISTVYKWLNDYEEFSKLYTRAREDQADALADEIIDVADDDDLDPNDKRVRVDARKWVASKLKPQKYADKVNFKHSGEVGLTSILNDIDGQDPRIPEGND